MIYQCHRDLCNHQVTLLATSLIIIIIKSAVYNNIVINLNRATDKRDGAEQFFS